MDKVVLVSGANGFIGRHFVHSLLQQQDAVIVATDITSSPAPMYRETNPRLNYVAGDITDPGFIKQLSESHRYDHIVHFAAMLGSGGDSSARVRQYRVNTMPVFHLCEIARAHDAHILFPSTGLVYDNRAHAPFKEDETPCRPSNFYAMTKKTAEEMILHYAGTYGIQYTIFRPAVVYGPGQRGAMFIPQMMESLVQRTSFDMTAGEQKRDFIFVDDFVNALQKAIYAPFQAQGVFNVSSIQAVSMQEVVATAYKVSGLSGLVNVGALEYRPNETWNYCLDNTKLRTQLQWKPWTALENGIRAVWIDMQSTL